MYKHRLYNDSTLLQSGSSVRKCTLRCHPFEVETLETRDNALFIRNAKAEMGVEDTEEGILYRESALGMCILDVRTGCE